MPSIKENADKLQKGIEEGHYVPIENLAVPPAGLPLPTYPAAPNTFLRTPMPPSTVQSPDQQRQWQSAAVPQARVSPFTPSSNPAVGAASASQAIVVASGISQVIRITLDMPTDEFAVAGSPAGATGTFTVSWQSQASGTVFSGPPANAVGFDVSFSSSGSSLAGGVASITAGNPSQSGEWALYVSNIVGGVYSSTPASPWVVQTGSSVTYPIYSQAIPAGALSVAVSQNYTGAAAWAGSVLYFGGSVPTFVQAASGSTDATGLATVAFAGALTAGNAVLVIVNPTMVVNGSTPITVTDGQGMTPIQLASSSSGIISGLGEGAQCTAYIMFGASNAGDTITVQINSAGGVNGASVTIIEITPLIPIPARPRFRVPPAVSLSNVTGILGVFNGGLSANLSATGGTSQVLKQTTVGGAITVAQLSVADLSTATIGTGTKIMMATTVTGSGTVGVLGTSPSIATPTLTGATTAASFSMSSTVTKYNNINTVGQGVVPFYALVNNLTATANIALTTLYAVPAASPGLYRISFYVIVNRVATTSSTLPNLYLEWTDTDNATLQTMSFVSATPSTNTLTTIFMGSQIVSAKASTNIRYQTGDTTAYASSGGTTMQYTVRIRLEAL